MSANCYKGQFKVPRKLLPVLLVLAVFVVSAREANSIEPLRAAELDNLVRQDCGSCHGLTMKGGLGPALLPKNLVGIDASALAEIILEGVPGTPMPPWRFLITPKEAYWMVERLKEGLNK